MIKVGSKHINWVKTKEIIEKEFSNEQIDVQVISIQSESQLILMKQSQQLQYR